MSKRVQRPKHSHWRADGAAKEEFTEDAAKAKAQELSDADLDNGRLMTRPVAYKCGEGEHWHVGNANPRQRWEPVDA